MELIKDTEPQKDMTRLHIFHQLLATGEQLVVRGVANSYRHFPVTHGRSMWTWLQAVQRGRTFVSLSLLLVVGFFLFVFQRQREKKVRSWKKTWSREDLGGEERGKPSLEYIVWKYLKRKYALQCSQAYVVHAGIVFSYMCVIAAKTLNICHLVMTFLTFSLLILFPE